MNNPCLSDCIKRDGHAPGCPNAEAPTVEESYPCYRCGAKRMRMAYGVCDDCRTRIDMPIPAPVEKAGEVDFDVADRWAVDAAKAKPTNNRIGNLARAYLILKDEVIDHEQTERSMRAEVERLEQENHRLDGEVCSAAAQLFALRAEVEELREYIRRRDKSGRWGEERAALKAEVERLNEKLDYPHEAIQSLSNTNVELRAELQRIWKACEQEVLIEGNGTFADDVLAILARQKEESHE